MNSVKMTLLSMSSRSSVDRAPAWCLGGHRFVSCQGLRFFFVPRSCHVEYFIFHNLFVAPKCEGVEVRVTQLCSIESLFFNVFFKSSAAPKTRLYFASPIGRSTSFVDKMMTLLAFQPKIILCMEKQRIHFCPRMSTAPLSSTSLLRWRPVLL